MNLNVMFNLILSPPLQEKASPLQSCVYVKQALLTRRGSSGHTGCLSSPLLPSPGVQLGQLTAGPHGLVDSCCFLIEEEGGGGEG